MSDTIDIAEPESSLDLEAAHIERVERFRLRKVITVEDLLEALGYPGGGSGEPHRPSADVAPSQGRPRSFGRSWGWRAMTGRRAHRGLRRGLRWHV